MTENCNICFESFIDLQKRRRVIVTLMCGHQYCRICLKKYAQTQIHEWTVPTCPNLNCQLELSLKGLIPQKQVNAMLKTKLDVQQGRRQCPTEDCGYLEIQNGTLMCNKCLKTICNECEQLMSQHHICNVNDIKSVQSVRSNQRCPKCRIPFYKYLGCQNMECTICHHKFRMIDLVQPNRVRQCIKCFRHCQHHYFKEYCCACISKIFDQQIDNICQACEPLSSLK